MFGWKKFKMSQGRSDLVKEKVKTLIDIMLKTEIQILIAPNSDEYFLIDKFNKINVCLEHSNIKIANHDYLYNEVYPLAFIEKQKAKIKDVLEKRQQNLKKELFRNEVDLLNKIASKYGESN